MSQRIIPRRLSLYFMALALFAGCTAISRSGPSSVLSAIGGLYVREVAGNDKVIVFIHGILGDSISTWFNSQTYMYWPLMFAHDPDLLRSLRGVDVFVADYYSPLFSTSSNIEEVAQRLLQQLSDRRFFTTYEQIYIISHSMGGLVAKRALILLNRPSDTPKLRRVKAVLLFSTPSQGAELGDLAAWISLNPQFRDLATRFNTYLQSLENDWQALLRDRDQSGQEFPRVFCAYETLPTNGILVVPRIYTATRCDNTPIAFDFDHRDIVKPAIRDYGQHRWALSRILDVADKAASRPASRVIEVTDIIGESTARLDEVVRGLIAKDVTPAPMDEAARGRRNSLATLSASLRRVAVEKRLLARLTRDIVTKPRAVAPSDVAARLRGHNQATTAAAMTLKDEAQNLAIEIPVGYALLYESMREIADIGYQLDVLELKVGSGEALERLAQLGRALELEAIKIDAANEALVNYIKRRFPW